MKLWEIYNVALHVLNRSCTEESLSQDPIPTEVEYCNTFYTQACDRALAESDWSFFVRPIPVPRDLPSVGRGRRFSFMLPYGLEKLVPSPEAGPYQILGGYYLADEMPQELYGIFDDYMEMDHPRMFDNLVAYALAIILCPILAPGDQQMMQAAMQNYAWCLGALRQLEASNNSKEFLNREDPMPGRAALY